MTLFDATDDWEQELTVAMLDRLDPTGRTMAEFMLDGELRDAMASMLRTGEEGRL